jgi:hypothetical protein
MKTTSMLKTLSLCALVSLSLGAGLAQADNGSCFFGSASAPQANSANTAPRMNNGDTGAAMMHSMEARLNQQMERIEQGLRSGEISPMQAGKMMREQWEAVQFQRGFLEGSRAGGMGMMGGMGGMGGMANAGGGSCNLMQGIDAKQLAAKVAPVVGGMAAEGMQTATTVMRALAREAQKLIREEASVDDRFY